MNLEPGNVPAEELDDSIDRSATLKRAGSLGVHGASKIGVSTGIPENSHPLDNGNEAGLPTELPEDYFDDMPSAD